MANNEIKLGIDPALMEILRKIENREPLMKNIAGIMLDEVHQNFEQQGNPAWRALSEKTITDRRSKGYWPGKILQRTGQLLKSVTAKSDNNFSQVGTNKNYAAIHQFGGDIYQAARSELFTRKRRKKKSRKTYEQYGAEFYYDVHKGAFSKGSSFGKGFEHKARTIKVPPRPFLVLSDSAFKEIEDEIRKYITQ